MRTLTSIEGNRQRLDGGAMFGNAPKPLWTRWIPADDRNRIPLACRGLLVREPGRQVLLEAGIGSFFEPRLKDRYGVVEEEHVLLDSLVSAGTSHEEIDVVVLSHLHFDHAGGLLTPWEEGREPELLFPRARFVVGGEAWGRAREPHSRDRASFVPRLVQLLEASGRLEVVEGTRSDLLGSDWTFHPSHGHTPGMLVTEVAMPDGPMVFVADLAPGVPWIHVPITMGYDRFPEILVDEKRALWEHLLPRGARLYFTHDPWACVARLERDERGRYRGVEPTERLVEVDR